MKKLKDKSLRKKRTVLPFTDLPNPRAVRIGCLQFDKSILIDWKTEVAGIGCYAGVFSFLAMKKREGKKEE
jgi:hypothetical protein